MTLKTINNENFNLSMKLDINYDLKYINILIILDNLQNKKREMKIFKGNQLEEAMTQYKLWEEFIF